MNCDLLSFSSILSQQRMKHAEALFGSNVVSRILGYALFLLGVKKSMISNILEMKEGTLRTLIHSLHTHGLASLEDRRFKTSSFKPLQPIQITPTVEIEKEHVRVDLGAGSTIRIPKTNPVQIKVFLLTLLSNGLVDCLEAAQVLQLSKDRTQKSARKLLRQDVQAIIDQRKGQQYDYVFTPEAKGELIQQFIIDIVQNKRASGSQIAQNLQQRCNRKFSPRSILYQFSKLGLNHIKETLPKHLLDLKKNSLES